MRHIESKIKFSKTRSGVDYKKQNKVYDPTKFQISILPTE